MIKTYRIKNKKGKEIANRLNKNDWYKGTRLLISLAINLSIINRKKR